MKLSGDSDTCKGLRNAANKKEFVTLNV